MAKKFFYVCAGTFLLALSYHFGASTATAQAPSNPVVATFYGHSGVVTANGDVYQSASNDPYGAYVFRTNVFGSTPAPVRQSTFGQVKVGDR